MSDNPKDQSVPMYAGVSEGWRLISLVVGIVSLVTVTNNTEKPLCARKNEERNHRCCTAPTKGIWTSVFLGGVAVFCLKIAFTGRS